MAGNGMDRESLHRLAALAASCLRLVAVQLGRASLPGPRQLLLLARLRRLERVARELVRLGSDSCPREGDEHGRDD